jgi:hypothetical protein
MFGLVGSFKSPDTTTNADVLAIILGNSSRRWDSQTRIMMMDFGIKTKTSYTPTHLTLTMTWDEAKALYPLFGKFSLDIVNQIMQNGKHNKAIPYSNTGGCTCGDKWPCPVNERYKSANDALYEQYLTIGQALRSQDEA